MEARRLPRVVALVIAAGGVIGEVGVALDNLRTKPGLGSTDPKKYPGEVGEVGEDGKLFAEPGVEVTEGATVRIPISILGKEMILDFNRGEVVLLLPAIVQGAALGSCRTGSAVSLAAGAPAKVVVAGSLDSATGLSGLRKAVVGDTFPPDSPLVAMAGAVRSVGETADNTVVGPAA